MEIVSWVVTATFAAISLDDFSGSQHTCMLLIWLLSYSLCLFSTTVCTHIHIIYLSHWLWRLQ